MTDSHPGPGDLGSEVPHDDSTGRGGQGDLFGRGMLYVLVWSMQTILATVVSPLLVRMVSTAEFGSLAASIALLQLLSLFTVLGLDQALEMQRVEDRDDDERARGLLAAGIVYSLGVTAVAALTRAWWAPMLGFTDGNGIVALVLLWTAPGSAVLMMQSMLQAEDRLGPFSIVSLLATVGGQVMGLGLLLVFDRTAVVYTWGGVMGQFLAVLCGLIWTRPRLKGVIDFPTIKRALALGLPLVLAAMSVFALNAGDRFIVQRVLGEEQTARYQVAFTVGNVMGLLLMFLNRAWLPRLKSIVDPRERWEVVGVSRDGLYWLLGLALLGITVASPTLLRVFAPPKYDLEPLTVVVFIVALASIPGAAGGATARMLITMREGRPLAWGAVAALVVKIVATMALIHPLGLNGAALGTLLGLIAQALVLRLAIIRHHEFVRSSMTSLAMLTVCITLAGISLWLPQTMPWNIGRFVFAAICTIPFFLALRALQQGREPMHKA